MVMKNESVRYIEGCTKMSARYISVYTEEDVILEKRGTKQEFKKRRAYGR